MKTKKGIALAALLGLSLFAFTACGNGEQPATDGGETADANTPAETKGTIAYVVPSAGTPYYETGAQGAQEYGEQLGYEVVVKGPANADTAEQIQIIEDLINQGEVDAMVVACQDSSSTVPALKKAREAGIKVVTWDLDCEADGRDVYAGVMDLVEMGNYWVDSMVRTIGEEGQYAIITATMTNEFMNSRIENMKAYAAENYPGLELSPWNPATPTPRKPIRSPKT